MSSSRRRKRFVIAGCCLLALSAAPSFAEGPRIAVLPLATVDSQQPLAPGASEALLAAIATRVVELPSTFEVDDALGDVAPAACHRDDACLARVAKATGAGWALSVVALQRTDAWLVAAQVVAADGATARTVEPRRVATNAAGALDWPAAFEVLLKSLDLETLGRPAPVATSAVEPPPDTPPAPPADAPRATPPEPVAAPAVAVAQPAPVHAKWRTPVALALGGVAIAAGGAATTLALINLSDARALRAASHDGAIPADQVERAASLDERTAAATGLGIGAGVAAAAAVALLVTGGGDDGPVLVPVASPAGAGASLFWRWP